MANGLTRKQMLFAERVASGLSLSQAYREVYHCQHSKASTIRTEASRLANTPKMIQAIQNKKRQLQWEQLGLAHPHLAESIYDYHHGAKETVRLKAMRKLAKLI